MNNQNQGAATRARNEEIERRLTAGESGPVLAKEFGITQPRVHQIARAVREARGDIAPKPKAIRPRLRKTDLGLWECTDGSVTRRGETQKEAYDRWMTAAIAEAQPAPAARQPVPDPMPAYAGPVTVVPGMRPGKAFTLSPSMQLAAARALAAQPRMHSLAGARRGGE
ncbi:hypothetical protein [Achromobacter piechaudii]|uniref:RNA polymerase sigma-70 region 4 domain-containing protein n=1 Tax=Achromobacter piechaudii TaxID=72556 RepID=A0ABM8L2S9_9BURK|nr:hypothetical protein [Achromobacter piechaudii]CAB3728949.1 hypothetical protein LMG1873_04629 [Achromobacter piechaudii]